MAHLTKRGASPCVLLVEDDAFSRDSALDRLALLGVTDTCVAVDARSGLRALDSMAQPPSLIVCDLFMPDMDGIEFIVELAKRRYLGGLILVSAMNNEMLDVAQTIATAKGLKLLGCFTKPLHANALAHALGLPASG